MTNQQVNNERELFYKKFFIEIYETRKKMKLKGKEGEFYENFIVLEGKINDKIIELARDRRFYEILEGLNVKIESLKYINNDTYKLMKDEIIKELLEILYKLEIGDRY